MGEVYGAQFVNQYGTVTDSAFESWCLGLADIDPNWIKTGFMKLLQRQDKFVPNLNEFRSLCQPDLSDYGLPDTETAYKQACESAGMAERFKTYGHDAVRLAARETSSFVLRSMSRDKSFPLFKRNYEIYCNRVIAGETLENPVPKALPQTIEEENPTGVSHYQRKKKAESARKNLLAMVKGLK